MTLSPNALAFSTSVGLPSAAQTVTLSNGTGSALPVTGVTSSSAVFNVAGGTCTTSPTLAAGQSCNVQVTFVPVTVGDASGTLTIATGGTPASLAVNLSGTATASTGPDLVTSVTPATYLQGSVERGAWDLLMAARSACGFGLVQQDTRLDTAAASHARYLAQNSIDRNAAALGPSEDPSWSYFTGATPTARGGAAGFPTGQPVVESSHALGLFYVAGQNPPLALNSNTGIASMRALLESIYNTANLFTPARVGGIAATAPAGPSLSLLSQQQFRLVVDFSTTGNPQRLGNGNVATWPCEGVGGFSGALDPANEVLNPFPDVTGPVNYGTPIYLRTDLGATLTVQAASLTRIADASAVPLRSLTRANDANSQLGSHEAFLVPTQPLPRGSTYRLNATGTANGVAFTKSFTFATAP
ncbi:hypothetical protein [Piscinibacter koreensis]|uniref:SCP domain-containing protein n=1 Tax=Piscinibacter koreensis TaxID=2742824 RepID=A0A7Y6NKK9_9BURK|nr:hypothetical protein [Schlegelella koreensis]NUZ04811.1 hypothetical protein [Schlegelella koreensis]